MASRLTVYTYKLYIKQIGGPSWNGEALTTTRPEMPYLVPKHVMETRLWASFRAQTLARTVEGIMQNEAALRLLARLERVNDARRSRRRAGAPKTSQIICRGL